MLLLRPLGAHFTICTQTLLPHSLSRDAAELSGKLRQSFTACIKGAVKKGPLPLSIIRHSIPYQLPPTSIPLQVYDPPDLLKQYLSRNQSGPVKLKTTVNSWSGRKKTEF